MGDKAESGHDLKQTTLEADDQLADCAVQAFKTSLAMARFLSAKHKICKAS
jgi:hypothetical protein